MKLAKRLGYKLIIVLCIIATFCSFIASTPVHASKVNTNDFYYSGTSKGSYTVSKGLIDSIIESLGAILDYLLGLMTMGFRMVFVGWTALCERLLTYAIKGLSGDDVEVDGVAATGITSADGWITLDAIFFNQVPLLDINFFRLEPIEGFDSLGFELEEEGVNAEGEVVEHNAPMVVYAEDVEVRTIQGRTNDLKMDPPPVGEEEDKSIIVLLKELIAGWYYTFRLISIMVMLIFLVYIGIKMAITSVATDKAVYKKMLADWVVGMILVFSIHYVMLFVINFNEVLVSQISKLRTGASPLAVYEYGLEERAQEPIENDELELTLYDEVKTRAYDLKMTVGMTGMIMYMVLVYYAWKFTFIYLKRYLTVAVLVIMAPIVAASYAYNKVRSGKAQIISRWFKEFAFIVLLQSIHALMYVTFMQTALALSLGSISSFILTLILMNFMCKAEGIFRKIFGIGSQGAGLLEEIANGNGLKATLSNATKFTAAKEVKNLAVGYTKGVAGMITKPARSLGGTLFKNHMLNKAIKKDAEALDKAKDIKTGDRIDNYTDFKKYTRKRRAQVLEMGSILKQIKGKELDIQLLEDYVNTLEEGQDIIDENGNFVGVMTKSYIDEQKSKVEKLKYLDNMTQDEKDKMMVEYDQMHTRKGKLKAVSTYISDKWQDIFDPKEYTEVVYDEQGNKSYRLIETQKDASGKVLDSVGKRFSEKMSWKNIANISEEDKQNLVRQAELVGSEIYGFAGILFGMPLLVAEPAVGMASMAFGLNGIRKTLNGKDYKRERTFSGYSVSNNGRYTFNSFQGKSKKTIALGAKLRAKEQIKEIVDDHVEQDAKIMEILERDYPKTAAQLRNGTASASTMPAGKKLRGNGLATLRTRNNAWARYQDTMRAARKANAKATGKDLEKAGAEYYLEVLADNYLKLEHDEFKEDSARHTEAFETSYAAIMVAMEAEIEQKNQQELLRDNGYDVPVEDEIEVRDGKLAISATAENQLIEKALVTYALQTGTMDVSKIVVDDKMEQIENILKTDLMTKGLVDQATQIKDVIQNLDSKVKDAQVNIIKDKRHETSVQERMAGEAIISLMQEQGITDPSKITDDQAMQKYVDMYRAKTAEAVKSSEQSNNVLSQLSAQKEGQDEADTPKAFDIEKIKASATGAIQARKASFTDMAKKSMDTKVADELRETIKRKQKLELDTQILEHEEKLKQIEETAPQGTPISELFANLNGGLDSSADGSASVKTTTAEDTINMLQIQTQLHKDKIKMEMVETKRGEKGKTVAAMYREISGDREESRRLATPVDGARRVDRSADGSRRVGGQQGEKAEMSQEISDIIKNLKI